ncbi:hypothetical protein D9M68_524750 [compost metagenome]
MRSTVNIGVAFALVALAGCSYGVRPDQLPVVVDYYAGATDLSGYSGMGIGAGNTLLGKAGSSDPLRYPALEVKRCNAEMTACALGLVDLTSQVTILEVDPSTAKVQVVLDYRVGKEVRHEWMGSRVISTLPSDVEVINDSGQVTRSAEIPYGVVRSVVLPYGVALTLCVSPPGTSNLDERPCSENLRVRDPSVVPTL